MSSLQDRKDARRKSREEQRIQAMEQQVHLAAARRAGQGEFIGDLAGMFGGFVGGRGRLLVVGARLFLILAIGLWVAYLIHSAT